MHSSLLLSLILTAGAPAQATSADPSPSARSGSLPAVCFAPGSSAEGIAELYARLYGPGGERVGLPPLFQFQDGDRWSATATNPGPLSQGMPTTLTWSIVPDGTMIPGSAGEPNAPSDLKTRLNQIYGGQSQWLPLFQQVFDRWGQLTGVTYVYQATDDGAAFPGPTSAGAPGLLGVRGDVRIGGHFIDGNGSSGVNILAYTFFPDIGDMVLDTADSFFNQTSSNSIRLRNVLAHEHGHGLGLRHVCPVNQTKLMEPFVTTVFDGPQHDDILGGQRGYGDDREDNDTAATATNLGALSGTPTQVTGVSADDNADADFYRFTIASTSLVSVTVTPVGFTYPEGPQNPNGSCGTITTFNSLTLNDLGVELRASDGTTVLASANSQGPGGAETISNAALAAGTYYFRVFAGSANTVQLYQLQAQSAPAPLLAINDVSVIEGTGGTTTATFTVSLSAASGSTVSVAYATANGTATAGSDYTAVAGTLTFMPGQTTRPIPVPITPDGIVEPNETFFVNLSAATGAVLADAQGLGTIIDDDVPSMSINDVSLTEGDSGSTNAVFTVTITPAFSQSVSVSYATASGTATAGSDYTPVSGTLTFPPGATTRTISVPVIGDTVYEPDETLFVNLTGPVNATIADGQGLGTILNDDPVPALSIDDVSVIEGNAGTTNATFTASLSNGSYQAVTVSYATADGTATAGLDYTPGSGSLTFAPGTTTLTIAVPVLGDTLDEDDETFFVNLSNPIGAVLVDAQGTGTILDDDPPPTVSINDVSQAEGDAGLSSITFNVTLSTVSGRTVTLTYATADGTATAGSDYVSTVGALTFSPGTTTRTISVPIFGDHVFEPDETFFVNLGNPVHVTVLDGQGLGTITNDDTAGFTIDDVVVAEGRTGPVNATFTVTLSPASGSPTSVDFQTADGSATAASGDYNPASGTLSFAPGTPSMPVTVQVNPDAFVEGAENFTVVLQNPQGGPVVAFSPGTATILDPQGGADFNGDGKTDILFRHAISGKNVVWLMDGITRTSGVFTSPDQLPDTNWRMVGTSDFNADGKVDILWRHAVSGKNVVWYMNGITRTSGVFTNPDSLADTNWGMVGTGDFNSDGKPDILWRHAVSGKNVVWHMDGITRTGGVFTVPDALADTYWRMVGVGDFSSDGKPDILWRHSRSGKNVVWSMDGVFRTSGAFTNPDQLPDTNWQMVAVGDFDSDDKPDILFRHAVSGKNVVWYMDGITRTGGVFTNPDQLPDTNWKIVGPK